MDREQIKIKARKSAEEMVKAIPRTNYNDHYAAYIQGYEAALEQMNSSNDIQNVSDMLSVDYLQHMHTITHDEAESLLEFAKSHTIELKGCYGDGSIIYPMWKEANYR